MTLNYPLRGLGYFAKLYSKYIEKFKLNVYSKTKIHIPTPRYYVFYNGEDDQPDNSILRLSDMYDGIGDVDVSATMLNINYGRNQQLLDACKVLKDYSYLVHRVRELYKIMPIADAVDEAVNECIKNDVLAEFLSNHKSEVKNMFLTEYDEVKTMNAFRAEWLAEGESQMIYSMVQDGDILPSLGAKRLHIAEDQLKLNMIDSGYKWPES